MQCTSHGGGKGETSLHKAHCNCSSAKQIAMHACQIVTGSFEDFDGHKLTAILHKINSGVRHGIAPLQIKAQIAEVAGNGF